MKKTQHLSLVVIIAVSFGIGGFTGCKTAQIKDSDSQQASYSARDSSSAVKRRPSSEGSELVKIFRTTQKDGSEVQFLSELNKNKKVTDEFGEVTADNIDRVPEDLQASAVKELSHSSIFKTRFESDPVFASALGDAESAMKRTGDSYEPHASGGYKAGTSFTGVATDSEVVVSKDVLAARLTAADESFDKMAQTPELKNSGPVIDDIKRLNHEIADETGFAVASEKTCKDFGPAEAESYDKYMKTVKKQMDRTPCAAGGAFATFAFQTGLGRAPAAAAQAGVEMGEVCDFHPFIKSSRKLKVNLEKTGKVEEPTCK